MTLLLRIIYWRSPDLKTIMCDRLDCLDPSQHAQVKKLEIRNVLWEERVPSSWLHRRVIFSLEVHPQVKTLLKAERAWLQQFPEKSRDAGDAAQARFRTRLATFLPSILLAPFWVSENYSRIFFVLTNVDLLNRDPSTNFHMWVGLVQK